MKLICVEEHATDPVMEALARPVLKRDAPYAGLLNAHPGVITGRPRPMPMSEAHDKCSDLGSGRLRDMDEHGIDMQVVSYASVSQLVPISDAVSVVETANDRLSAAVAENPTRLAGLAALPWQAPRAAADELDRAVNELGLKGVLILGRPGPTFLDDPVYEPVLAKLSDLAVPIYVHPGVPVPEVVGAYYSGLAPEVNSGLALSGWGWHHEAGIHVIRLILSGAFERHPNLQVVSGHWGEMVPFYLQRLDDLLSPTSTGLSKTITETYRKHVWVTPSGMFYLAQFEFVRAAIGLERIIWSVDYPFLSLEGTRNFIDDLKITDDEAQLITHQNAATLFRL